MSADAEKVAQALEQALVDLRVGGRHTAMVPSLGRLTSYCYLAYPGAGEAIDRLREAFFECKRGDYPAEVVRKEWERAEQGAIAWCEDEAVLPRPEGFPSGWNDAEVGEAFAQHIRGEWMWVAAWGWQQWDGRRWKTDDKEAIFEEARQWVIKLGVEVWLTPGGDEGIIGKITKYKRKGALDSIVTVARRQAGIAASPEDFDQHPDLLNVLNGVVDLRNGSIGPHDPALRLTKLAGAQYTPGAEHNDVTHLLGVVDTDVRRWLQRLFGYAATGHTDEDVVAVFDGKGANGKTSLLLAVESALGAYASVASPRLIMKSAHEEHATLEADLFGRRLVVIEETPEGGVLRIERVKALSGGGTIKARYLYKDQFEFTPTHTLVIATNHRPIVNSSEPAAWRRLRLVPFPYTYHDPDKAKPGQRVKDPKLRQRLATGREQREAMLAWIVAGAVEWFRHGLGCCAAVDDATAAWHLEEDVIARFLDEVLVPDAVDSITGGELYLAYGHWCDGEGRPPKSLKNFVAELLDHPWVQAVGVERRRPGGVARYHGIRRRNTADPDEPWSSAK